MDGTPIQLRVLQPWTLEPDTEQALEERPRRRPQSTGWSLLPGVGGSMSVIPISAARVGTEAAGEGQLDALKQCPFLTRSV